MADEETLRRTARERALISQTGEADAPVGQESEAPTLLLRDFCDAVELAGERDLVRAEHPQFFATRETFAVRLHIAPDLIDLRFNWRSLGHVPNSSMFGAAPASFSSDEVVWAKATSLKIKTLKPEMLITEITCCGARSLPGVSRDGYCGSGDDNVPAQFSVSAEKHCASN